MHIGGFVEHHSTEPWSASSMLSLPRSTAEAISIGKATRIPMDTAAATTSMCCPTRIATSIGADDVGIKPYKKAKLCHRLFSLPGRSTSAAARLMYGQRKFLATTKQIGIITKYMLLESELCRLFVSRAVARFTPVRSNAVTLNGRVKKSRSSPGIRT